MGLVNQVVSSIPFLLNDILNSFLEKRYESLCCCISHHFFVILIEIPWILRSSSGLALVLIAIAVTNILNAIAIITKVKD